MLEKAKAKVSKTMNDVRYGIPAKLTVLGLMGAPMTVFAADPTKKIIGKVLGIVCTVFLYVGVFFLAVGIGNLISALKQEDGDRQQKAITGIVIAVVMIGLKAILNGVLKVTDTNVTIS